MACLYTVSQKTSHFVLSISLTNIYQFSKFFIGMLSGQLAIKLLLNTVTVSLHYQVKYKCKKIN